MEIVNYPGDWHVRCGAGLETDPWYNLQSSLMSQCCPHGMGARTDLPRAQEFRLGTVVPWPLEAPTPSRPW